MPTTRVALSLLRSSAGAISWVSPRTSWRLFGLGPLREPGSAGAVTRLFGVRDLALGLALHHPSADVRRAVLQAGVALDSADVVSSVLAHRAGAPRASLLGVAGGAALFVGLGLAALVDDDR